MSTTSRPSIILALDQAFEKTGWAAGPPSGAVASGLIHIKAGRFDDLGSRFLRFEQEIATLFAKFHPTFVAFEAHRAHSSVQAAQVLGAVSALVMKEAKLANVPYMGVEVKQLKKSFTGTGNAGKALMLAVARKRYPTLPIASDDVADALAIHEWAAKKLLNP